MRYNKSEIMKEAWTMYKSSDRDLFGRKLVPFATCLRIAWSNAKAEARKAEKVVTVEELESRLFILQMKDRFTHEDYECARELQTKIASMKQGQFAA